MKILLVSDTVTTELLDNPEIKTNLNPLDLIISCGDLPPEYLTGLRHHYDAPLLYVLGNHDLRYDSSPPAGCSCIDRKVVTMNNTRIIGFSGSRWYNGGINQYTEKEMDRFIARMRFNMWRKGTPDIVVTHAPPRHIHDANDPCHKGFNVFTKFIKKYTPAYFIHGHIHRFFEKESDRLTQVNTTTVINSYGFHILEI